MPIAKVTVTLKEGVLDPQGQTVRNALEALGYDVRDVRMGKYLELTLPDVPHDELEGHVAQMCEKLLANPVIEDYRFTIES
ncbi:MAG: phosphoribosylformylglycinamidine synthase subunit PurS [Candidatus Tectimicrobiota bacterium]